MYEFGYLLKGGNAFTCISHPGKNTVSSFVWNDGLFGNMLRESSFDCTFEPADQPLTIEEAFVNIDSLPLIQNI